MFRDHLDTLKRQLTKQVLEPYTPSGGRRGLRVVINDKGIPMTDRGGGSLIPQTVVTEVPDMLGIANAVLGVANLGVGIYNGYHITKARKDIARVETSVARVEDTVGRVEESVDAVRHEVRDVKRCLVRGFEHVSEQLHVLGNQSAKIIALQREQSSKLERLTLEVLSGFDVNLKAVEKTTADRRFDEYWERVSALQRARQEVAKALARDESPSVRDLDAMENAADRVLSWVDARLRDAIPLEGRQPLVMAEIDAELAKADARSFREQVTGQAVNVAARADRIAALREKLAKEVQLLHEGATPWRVFSVFSHQVARYAVVRAAMGNPHPAPTEEGQLIAVQPWDAGLPTWSLKDTAPKGDPATRKIRTVKDMEWACSMFELDPAGTDVTSIKTVSAIDLAARLNAPRDAVSFDLLTDIANPSVWRHYEREVQRTFSVDVRVPLLPAGPAKPKQPKGLAGSRKATSAGKRRKR